MSTPLSCIFVLMHWYFQANWPLIPTYDIIRSANGERRLANWKNLKRKEKLECWNSCPLRINNANLFMSLFTTSHNMYFGLTRSLLTSYGVCYDNKWYNCVFHGHCPCISYYTLPYIIMWPYRALNKLCF